MIDKNGELKNAWYVIALTKVIKNKPYSSTVFGVPLVSWRGRDGAVSTMLDRCNHRNAPLNKGEIVNDCIVCPYHGWVYDKNGQCIEIPSEGPHIERIPNKRIESFPTMEKYGLIWVWMGRTVEPNEEPFEMPMKNEKGWSNYYMVTKFKSNVTDLVENFMDVPHTVFVHKGWFRNQQKIRVKAEVERTDSSVLVTFDQPKDSISFSSKLINPKSLPMVHTDKFFMPNITRVDYIFGEMERAFIITSTCTPVSEEETIVYTLITYKFGWLNFLAKPFLPLYTKKVIDQDVWIMNIHTENRKKFHTPEYKSTQADTMHVYIESLRNYAANNDNSAKPKPISKEIEFWL